MAEEKDVFNEHEEKYLSEEIFTKVIRAGKRTYFFDVKSTRKNDYYITITESKKRTEKDSKPVYEKQKVFIYREDFDKFSEGLNATLSFIEKKAPEQKSNYTKEQSNTNFGDNSFTDVDFDDLGK